MSLIKFKRGSKASLPTLNVGEPAFTTDTHDIYFGDGSSNYRLKKHYDGAITNFNSVNISGIYTFDNTAINGALATSYGVLEVIETFNTAWLWQIAFYTSGEIAYRYNINSGGWSTWNLVHAKYKVYLTPSSGWTKVSGNFYIKRDENIITIFADSLSGTANTTIATIPSDYNPNNLNIDFKNGLKLNGTTLTSTNATVVSTLSMYSI